MTAVAVEPKQRCVFIDLSSLFHPAWHANENYPMSAYSATIDAVARCTKKDPNALVAICIDSPKSWRKELAPAYKAQREKLTPVFYQTLDKVKAKFREDGRLLWESEGFEADDVIATATEEAVSRGHTVAICSADKDLMQLLRPGVIQLRTYGEWSVWGELEAEAHFGVKVSQIGDWLALVGDASDNIKGCRGIGKETAPKLLKDYGNWAGIVKAMENRSFTPKITAALQDFDYETTRKLIELRKDVPINFDEIYQAPGSSAAEQPAYNRLVVGSNPTPGTSHGSRPTEADAATSAQPGAGDEHGSDGGAAVQVSAALEGTREGVTVAPGELPPPITIAQIVPVSKTPKPETEIISIRETAPVAELVTESRPVPSNDVFTGIAASAFSPEAQAILCAPLTYDEISVRPDDGILYMAGEAVRQRLNKAFGLGGWGIRPIATIVDKDAVDKNGKPQPKVFYTGQLWALGRFVSESTGDGNWIKGNPKSDYGTALEGAKTNCISRCCKDIGMWSELRDKEFTKAWSAKHVINSPRDGWIKRPKQPNQQKQGA